MCWGTSWLEGFTARVCGYKVFVCCLVFVCVLFSVCVCLVCVCVFSVCVV